MELEEENAVAKALLLPKSALHAVSTDTLVVDFDNLVQVRTWLVAVLPMMEEPRVREE